MSPTPWPGPLPSPLPPPLPLPRTPPAGPRPSQLRTPHLHLDTQSLPQLSTWPRTSPPSPPADDTILPDASIRSPQGNANQTTVRCHGTPTKEAGTKTFESDRCGRGCGGTRASHTVLGVLRGGAAAVESCFSNGQTSSRPAAQQPCPLGYTRREPKRVHTELGRKRSQQPESGHSQMPSGRGVVNGAQRDPSTGLRTTQPRWKERDMCDNVDEPRGPQAQWEEPDTEDEGWRRPVCEMPRRGWPAGEKAAECSRGGHGADC